MFKARILVLDDDPEMLELAQFHLSKQQYDVRQAACGEEALRLSNDLKFDLALIDLHLPDIDGLHVVRKLREISPDTEIIMITGFGSVACAIEAIKSGAFYFIEKPIEFEELFLLIEKALERRQQAAEIELLRGQLAKPDRYHNIIGGCKLMQELYEIIDRVAESDANIMIIGESGTGKELIANAIHYKSNRSKKPFVKINCAALPKELIESELFGHTKGAFTGASGEKQGLIGQAKGGSLLLDEIGEMPLELQPKLLRVLQERVYYRLGSEKALEADFRLISSTNRNPVAAIGEGILREDLFYRINTIEIHLPPLRDRAEDVQHLAEHFLKMFAAKYQRPVTSISRQAYADMFNYQWPGNIRELQNVIERAVLLCEGDTIEKLALNYGRARTGASIAEADNSMIKSHVATATTESPETASKARVDIDDITVEQLGKIIIKKSNELKSKGAPADLFTKVEGAIVKAAIERTRGNKQAAANLLGVHRPRLYHLLRKHNFHNLIKSVSQTDLQQAEEAELNWDEEAENIIAGEESVWSVPDKASAVNRH